MACALIVFLSIFLLLFSPLVLSEQETDLRDLEPLVRAMMRLDKTVWITHFHCRRDAIKGLSVMASRDMKEGELLVELPYSLHINSEFAAPFLPRNLRNLLTDRQLWIAVYLALERFGKLPRETLGFFERMLPWHRRVSKFSEFVDLMPSHVPNSAHWTAEDRLQASKLGKMTFWHNLNESWPLVEQYANLTLDEYTWGYSMLLSRSFSHIYPYGDPLLFPIADLLNHDPENFNVEANVIRQVPLGTDITDPWAFRLTRNVSKGQELLLSYGPRPNIGLLQMYGFTLPRNPLDQYVLHSFTPSAFLERIWGHGNASVSISWHGVTPFGIAEMLNVHDGRFESSSLVGNFRSNRGTGFNKATGDLCRKEIRTMATARRNARLLPVIREKQKMLEFCIQASHSVWKQ